jgi:hypothetical protein
MSKKIHKMTEGEKVVWAAVFAREFDLHNPPRQCLGASRETDQLWREWEQSKCHSAAEVASAAVMHLREQREAIEEGHKGYPTQAFVNQLVTWI